MIVMKIKSFVKKFFPNLNLLILMFVLIASSLILMAKEKKSTDFKIIMEKTDDGIKMTCENGCAWKELTFSINEFEWQTVDEYGMTEVNKSSSDKEPKQAEFLFSLKKTKEEIILKGIEGTLWTDLSFSIPKDRRQAIDKLGMTELK